MDQDELVGSIRQWLEIETTIKNLQSKMKQLKQTKKQLSENLVEFMRENEVDCFDVKNGKILYSQRKVKAPLNKKNLQLALEQFFSTQPNDLSSEALQFVLESRPETIKENIRLKSDK